MRRPASTELGGPEIRGGLLVPHLAGRHGYVSEAVRALVSVAENHLAAMRIELITDAENQRSRTVAERCGFSLEGQLNNERRSPDGSLRNICIYARTARPT